MATDYSVQVSLTTQIILSDDNQTKIVTTAIIILVLAAAGSDCNIHLHKMLPTTNSATDFFYVSAAECQRVWPNNSW